MFSSSTLFHSRTRKSFFYEKNVFQPMFSLIIKTYVSQTYTIYFTCITVLCNKQLNCSNKSTSLKNESKSLKIIMSMLTSCMVSFDLRFGVDINFSNTLLPLKLCLILKNEIHLCRFIAYQFSILQFHIGTDKFSNNFYDNRT